MKTQSFVLRSWNSRGTVTPIGFAAFMHHGILVITYPLHIQSVRPTRKHLDTHMESSSGPNIAIKRRPEEARRPEQKCRNVSQKSPRLSFCVKQTSNPYISGRQTDGLKMNCPLPHQEETFSDCSPSRPSSHAWIGGSELFIRDLLRS
jgi:hypothetical protein